MTSTHFVCLFGAVPVVLAPDAAELALVAGQGAVVVQGVAAAATPVLRVGSALTILTVGRPWAG